MLGLFLRTYDYYEWKDLIAVSEDRQKLRAHVAEDHMPILTGSLHKKAAESEKAHFTIEKVKLL